MNSNFSPLSDVADVIDSLHKTPAYSDSGPPMVRVTDVKYGYLSVDNCLRVSEDTFEEFSRRYKPKPGDIVITRVGSYGNTALVNNTKFCLGQNTAAIIPKTINNRYLYAALNSPQVKAEIDSQVVGSTQKTLSLARIKALKIPRHPHQSEENIANLIGSLDDRITLLREANKTLEAIAQAIFKSWFVDFDPVRAKMEGRQPEGMDEATAALFPDSFDESELGLVPKGWRVQQLDQIAEYLNGLALQKYPPTGINDLPVIKIAQLRKGDTLGSDKASREIKPEYIIQDGDVLFSWSGSLEVEVWCGGEGALNQHLFKVTSRTFPKWLYLYATKLFLCEFRKIAESKATTMGHIQRRHLSDAKLALPDNVLISKLSEVFEPLLDRYISNSLQARTLVSIRDALLPRLISGQLRLPEAQEQIENALT